MCVRGVYECIATAKGLLYLRYRQVRRRHYYVFGLFVRECFRACVHASVRPVSKMTLELVDGF